MKPSRDDFTRLVLEQLDTLYRVARRLTQMPADAEDLVQETLLRGLSAADRFRLQDFGIRPWLLRIMHNLHITRSGREAREPRGWDDSALTAVPDPKPAALPVNLSDSLDGPLANALEELPGEFQQVLLLWAVEELSYQEIAGVLSIPLGTVMSRLHRGRERLREQLGEYSKSHGIGREYDGRRNG